MKTAIASLLIISLLSSSDACSCFPEHPQRQLCRENSFVALVIVRSEANIRRHSPEDHVNKYYGDLEDQTDEGIINRLIPTHKNTEQVLTPEETEFASERRYRIKILQSFKGLENVTEEMKNFLYTSYFSSSCGGYLNLKTTYLVTGNVDDGRLKFSLCSYNVEWRPLPKLEKANILANMKMLDSVCESGCLVTSCFWWDCEPENSTEECIWNSKMENNYAQKYNRANFVCARDMDGRCDWTGANVGIMERLTRVRRQHKRQKSNKKKISP